MQEFVNRLYSYCMNCIIIDDEEMARAIITQLLYVQNLNFQEFPNAIQAIKNLRLI
jgi:Zn-finger protein